MLNDNDLDEMENRFRNEHFGCPKSQRDLSYGPWVKQLMMDALALLHELRRERTKSKGRKAALSESAGSDAPENARQA